MNPVSPRIFITGLGLISPLGLGVWPTFRSLLAGRTLGDRADALPDSLEPVDFVKALGCVASTAHAGDDPVVELAERAAREAATEAGVDLNGLRCCIGTSKGAVGSMIEGKNQSLAVTHGPHGYLTMRLRERLKLGLTEHYVAACASSLTALHHARLKMLRPDGPDAMLVLTAEAALLPMFIHSYRRLGVLAPQTPEGYATGPLDEGRRGFMLSELAAAVVLQRSDKPIAGKVELLDTAIATEAHHLVQGTPDMPALRHIANELLADHDDIILHPHATGTHDHDPAERRVMSQMSCNIADIYACKGALGHGLGAAGLVSLVLACLCARSRKRPPMPWLRAPICDINPKLVSLDPELPHAIFAAGFAGHTAGAVIR